jgi:hypothetical protein
MSVVLFRWLVAAAVICQVSGAALLLWGLKVVAVSNPFTPLVRESAEPVERAGSSRRERPRAVASGALLFILGLALAVAAGVVRP